MEWRIIPQYPRYEASDTGLIRNIRTGTIRKGVLGGPKRCQYLRVGVNGRKPKQPQHRLVLLAFVGPPPQGKPYGLHRDGNRMNNALSNLYWGSGKENVADAKQHHKHWWKHGEAAGPAKLTNEQAREILRLHQEAGERRGMQTELARRFNVSISTIHSLVHRRWWKWLDGDNKRS